MDDKSLFDFLTALEDIYEKDTKESDDDTKELKKDKDVSIVVEKKANSVFDFTVGTNENGEELKCNILSAPHILICGENTDKLIKNLVLEITKKDNFKLALFGDTEKYACFKSLPQLMHEITFDDKKIEGVLKYLYLEMENRFQLLEDAYTRNIQEYNRKTSNVLPYIFVIIDGYEKLELYNNKIIKYLLFLAQKARASGIHLIIGAQNLCATSLAGYVFNNVPTRIVSKVKDKNTSLAAIFHNGAQNLENDKLMYFGIGYTFPKTLNNPKMIDENDALKNVSGEFVKDENVESFVSEHIKTIKEPSEDLIRIAKEHIDKLDTFFATTFQKEMKIGYKKACLILSTLVRDGYIHRESPRLPYKKIKE